MEAAKPKWRLYVVRSLAVLLLVSGIFFAYKKLFLDNSRAKPQTKSTQELAKAACSDASLFDFKRVADSHSGDVDASKKVSSLKDFAYCYMARKDYQKAADALSLLADTYKTMGKPDLEADARKQADLQKTLVKATGPSAEEVHSDEPLTN